jgi:hypothetical protein
VKLHFLTNLPVTPAVRGQSPLLRAVKLRFLTNLPVTSAVRGQSPLLHAVKLHFLANLPVTSAVRGQSPLLYGCETPVTGGLAHRIDLPTAVDFCCAARYRLASGEPGRQNL